MPRPGDAGRQLLAPPFGLFQLRQTLDELFFHPLADLGKDVAAGFDLFAQYADQLVVVVHQVFHLRQPFPRIQVGLGLQQAQQAPGLVALGDPLPAFLNGALQFIKTPVLDGGQAVGSAEDGDVVHISPR